MTFFADNFSWMAFNTILAFAPIILVVLLRFRLNTIVHLILFFFWLIFLPNTIYLVTDLQHLPYQILRVKMSEQLILIFQYSTLASLGVMTYAYSLEPISAIFKKLKLPEMKKEVLYILINYVIAFGVIMGKVQRTHSWYIFTNPARVVEDMIATATNTNLLVLIFLFGSVVNILFFLFKDYFPPLKNSDLKKKKKK